MASARRPFTTRLISGANPYPPMRPNLLLAAQLLAGISCAQWTVTSAINTDARKDDLFFIGADTGWVAGGLDGWILRTSDGGDNWQVVHFGEAYLRSIEFATPQLGFCGSLDGDFLRSTNGGESWQDISGLIPAPTSICGLYAASPQVIYGAGIWSGPAYVIRSTDGGTAWDKIALDSLSDGLVDLFFLNADTGFAAGSATPFAQGGVILATTDGGDTWSVRYQTGVPGDVVWKLQSPDGVHLYGSLEAAPGTATRFIRSNDAGLTWQMDTALLDYHYMQAIGFLDTLHGWMGGDDLLETLDGGATWHVDTTCAGASYDRFHRVNGSLAYLSGTGVYKYGQVSTAGMAAPRRGRPERLAVVPNPADEEAQVVAELLGRSQAELMLCTADGRILRTLYKGALPAGERRFTLLLKDLPAGTYYVSMRTNLGRRTTVFIRQ